MRFTVVLQHPGALRKMFLPPNDLTLGEAYIYNDFDIEGDIEAVFPLAEHFTGNQWGKMEQVRFGKRLLSLPNTGQARPGDAVAKLQGTRHSKERDWQAVTYHYNRSNAFYALWLDSRMVYSCAYFANPDDDLDTAQERKLEYICRKLRLRPGERLLDIGCGWGGLVIYAAQHYGVEARSVGSIMFSLAALGPAALPWVVGIASQSTGTLRVGLTVPLIATVILFFVHLKEW